MASSGSMLGIHALVLLMEAAWCALLSHLRGKDREAQRGQCTAGEGRSQDAGGDAQQTPRPRLRGPRRPPGPPQQGAGQWGRKLRKTAASPHLPRRKGGRGGRGQGSGQESGSLRPSRTPRPLLYFLSGCGPIREGGGCSGLALGTAQNAMQSLSPSPGTLAGALWPALL